MHLINKEQNNNIPKYKVIADDLYNKIKNNSFKDHRLPSERKLAIDYNVNRLTLRKALKILFEKRLITKLGQKGTYITNSELRLHQMQNKRIACFLIHQQLSDSFHGAILNYAQQELQSQNSSIMFYYINSCADIEKINKANTISKEFDGIIVNGTTTQAILKTLEEVNTPIVLIGYIETPCELEAKYDQVIVDIEYCTYKCVCSLAKAGHRKIAFIDGPAYQWSQKSQTGYMKALAESGIEYNENLVFRVNSMSAKSGLILTDIILKHKPSALFIRNEVMTRGIYDGITLKGIKIPEDMAIIYVGHPNDSIAHIGLPCIIIEPKQLAKNSLELLFKRLSFPYADIEKRYLRFNADLSFLLP